MRGVHICHIELACDDKPESDRGKPGGYSLLCGAFPYYIKVARPQLALKKMNQVKFSCNAWKCLNASMSRLLTLKLKELLLSHRLSDISF